MVLTAPLTASERVHYGRQVKPILVNHCYRCHGLVKQESELRLDTRARMLDGGEQGPAIVPGDVLASRLLQAVRHENDLQMPPDAEQITAEEIAILEAWVAQGAQVDPEDDLEGHWAYLPPSKAALPEVAAPWSTNPIDRFIAQQHAVRGLQPVPEAAREVLLRRVYLDLIGLPPTPSEITAFLADPSPDAYERVVQRLLDSPQYGERWGRHWMDVWRYSDWAGYQQEVRESQPHIWRWREWIIESLNEDAGYDQMVVQMLAADEIAPTDADSLRATGFLVRNWYKFNRNTWLEDTVEHTAKAFLGTTIACARCHDHMYDPITQDDYYRFRAFFEPHQIRTDRLPGVPDVKQDGVARVYDAELAPPTYLFMRGDERKPDTSRTLSPGLPVALGGELPITPIDLPPTAYYPGLLPYIQEEVLAAQQQQLEAAQAEVHQREDAVRRSEETVASSSAATKTTAPSTEPMPVLVDEFPDAQLAQWEIASGQWVHENGHLVQQQTGATEFRLDARTVVPRDFTAKLRFRIVNGEMWKSVGLTFDRQPNGDGNSVYASAYEGGPKLQVSYRIGGSPAYPDAGRRDFAIELSKEYELELRVVDRTVNVLLNGEFQLAYQLEAARQLGGFSIWAFDAVAEFHHLSVMPLDPSTMLVTAGGQAVVDPTKQLSMDQAALSAAQKKLEAAQTSVEWTRARIEADRARYTQPPAANSAALIEQAARLEKQWAVLDAEVKLLAAKAKCTELEVSPDQTLSDEQKKKIDEATAARVAAEQALAQAQAARDQFDPAQASYTPISELYPAQSSGRRLALARWVASSTNPLTARVAVNHMWMRHFDRPLVARVEDFGLNSPRPDLANLLDWLAVEFMESGWRMKHMHYLMVTSRLYRLQSAPAANDSANLKVDPDNRLFWRMNVRRMEAEVVRDSVLYVAGRLDLTRGGPDVDQTLGLNTLRRSLYYRHAYEKQMLMMKIFDTASVEECYRRSESIIPQQALALTNSPLALASARLLARDIAKQVPGDRNAQVREAFLRVLGRDATSAELDVCATFLDEQTKRLENPQDLTRYVASAAGDAEVPPAEAPGDRAWEDLVHVLLNHNDFITIR